MRVEGTSLPGLVDRGFAGIFIFFYIFIFYIVSFFEGTSLPGLVDRSIVEVLCVQLVADVLRHRLGADVDANQWCSPRQNL